MLDAVYLITVVTFWDISVTIGALLGVEYASIQPFDHGNPKGFYPSRLKYRPATPSRFLALHLPSLLLGVTTAERLAEKKEKRGSLPL